MSAQSSGVPSTSGSVNARATENTDDEQPQELRNQQAQLGSATSTDSDCVPYNDSDTQTEAIAGPSEQEPEAKKIS